MLDFPKGTDTGKFRDSANDDKAHSHEGDLASDALGVPLLIKDPAPLSDALNIPTLIGETSRDENKAVENHSYRPEPAMASSETTQRSPYMREPNENVASASPARPDESSKFDMFGRKRSGPDEVEPQNANRATTPAGKPQSDAWSWIGVPSNHPKTHVSGKLAKLDKAAVVLGALITIGPLFAAMIGRMAL